MQEPRCSRPPPFLLSCKRTALASSASHQPPPFVLSRNMRFSLRVFALAAAAASLPGALGEPFAPAFCQSSCYAGIAACYGAAGLTFGTVPVAGPPAITVCNALFGTCMAGCEALG
ncbi:hypothetical protein DFH11DRAFT_1640741 [Phellopilus nigrolimitatus]|nr:hypothetical protein DFH11DRAFT_1640741 [Phellopilus nigrolimitatus]